MLFLETKNILKNENGSLSFIYSSYDSCVVCSLALVEGELIHYRGEITLSKLIFLDSF